MLFVPQEIGAGFETGPDIKLYPCSLPKGFSDCLDREAFDRIVDSFGIEMGKESEPSPTITIIRHLQSQYNVYRETSDFYREFREQEDPKKKKKLAKKVMKEYLEKVGLDPLTPLSEAGIQDGKSKGVAMAEFYEAHPELFPRFITVSPHLRTRLTTKLMFEQVTDFSIDWSDFERDIPTHGMYIGKFQDEEVVVQLHESATERSFGANLAPLDVEVVRLGQPNIHEHLSAEAQEHYWYSMRGVSGGESQPDCANRYKQLMYRHAKKTGQYPHSVIVGHHLGIVGAQTSICGPSLPNHLKFNRYLRPGNGTVSLFVKVGEKVRMATFALTPTAG